MGFACNDGLARRTRRAQRCAEDAEKGKGENRNGDECGIRAGWVGWGKAKAICEPAMSNE